MKKYYQLLLFILSISSLSLFLIYRREYNRLHYVLEVFNFFGQPCNITDVETTVNVANHYDWGVEPVWQDSDEYYIFSAFWTSKNEVVALALLGPSQKVATKCYLWYENHYKPIIGRFHYSIVLNDLVNSQSECFYYCASNTLNQRRPYAVSFSVRDRHLTELKKVLVTVERSKRRENFTTICVSPSPFNKSSLLEFISYHKLIGVESYIFYTNDIPFRLQKVISNLSNRLGIKVAFFKWNFPLYEGVLTRSFIENDCLLRVRNITKNVITLEVNEYVVPEELYSLNDVLTNYEGKSGRLSLPVQIYCIKHVSPKKPIALQNTEVMYNDENIVRYIYKNIVNSKVVDTPVIVKGVASIHKYINCSEKAARVYQDNSILKYSTDFIRSTLVQLSLYGQI